MTGKKIKKTFVIEIDVEGYADSLAFFDKVAEERIKGMGFDVTTAGVWRNNTVYSASVKTGKIKIVEHPSTKGMPSPNSVLMEPWLSGYNEGLKMGAKAEREQRRNNQ